MDTVTYQKRSAKKRSKPVASSIYIDLPTSPEKPEHDRWHAWTGTVHVFIIGPGLFAMHKISAVHHQDDPELIKIATAAVRIMNDELGEQQDLPQSMIDGYVQRARRMIQEQSQLEEIKP